MRKITDVIASPIQRVRDLEPGADDARSEHDAQAHETVRSRVARRERPFGRRVESRVPEAPLEDERSGLVPSSYGGFVA